MSADFLFGVPGKLKTLLDRLTATRAGYLDAAITSRAPSSTALSSATWTAARAGYLDDIRKHSFEKITGSKTWTRPAGVDIVFVSGVAPGGSGRNGSNPSGGGAGEAVFRMPIPVSANVSVTVGSPGAAVTGTSDGNDGGTTSFGSLLTLLGGKGGTASVGGAAGDNPDGSSGDDGFAGPVSAIGGWGGAGSNPGGNCGGYRGGRYIYTAGGGASGWANGGNGAANVNSNGSDGTNGSGGGAGSTSVSQYSGAGGSSWLLIEWWE